MMKLKMMLVAVLLSAVNVGFADTFGTGANEFDIDFVTISGDTNPTSGYGMVTGDYRMGVLEISNDQYAKFASNTHSYSGTDPANTVTWYEAAKFVNYLNISTGNDEAYKFTADVMGVWQDGEDGYDASNPYRNSNAKYFMPTEDEWVKAAYWNSTSLSLQTYATKDGSLPTADVDTNYDQGYPYVGPWNIGNGSEELNGTKNMMGNVFEWMESPYSSGNYSSDSDRAFRGGAYLLYDNYLSSSSRSRYDPDGEFDYMGFRVASVPEPCSLVLLSLGGLALRRRRRA